ncbi:putative nicotinate phosphoribosyltransferase [Wallemia mellicola]|uniref:Nicotinate phosphoribosyltransferase n=1 Tax=Wallemia mellicola TaxID=1708541 RepID=A0A4T0R1N0_9BASI|nr:putative nicotinate phosphoribosyltransferase [Wallemia mellicola]TIC31596.1 putative nicotinate phosphoribosyltransferase [Wallemia mellicola]TIC32092.1 putative nicotinate phosphoribosyltransferase [Wallemia mellicola]
MRFNGKCLDAINEGLHFLSELTLQPSESGYLRSDKAPMFKPSYVDYLENYRFKPSEQIEVRLVNVDESGFGDLEIDIRGLWVETILYEVPLMSIVSEAYFAHVDTDWTYDGQAELAKAKMRKLAEGGIILSEFGSRRRRSLQGHDIVIRALKEESELLSGQKGITGKLAGTSNVYFAFKYDLPPIGTVAHEWTMGIAAMTGYPTANFTSLKLWEQTFGNSLLIALTDTFTTDAFWREFLEHPEKAKKWAGIRQDSGDPVKFCEDAKRIYEKLGISPSEKTIVFSDSLDDELCIKLKKVTDDYGFKSSFGVGTFLTNVIMFARQIVRAAARNARIVTRAPVAARSFSFTPLRFGAGSTDSTLTAQLANEISFETENASPEEPEWVRVFRDEKVWSIEDKSGSDEIVLSRQFGNEHVRVLFSISDLEQDDGGSGEVQAEPVDEVPAYSVRMSVSITKPNSGALTIDCVSQNESILIDNISYYQDAKLATQLTADADFERRGLYIGPVFDHLDLDVQSEFQQFLVERGIDERLATFVPEYAVYKEQKEKCRQECKRACPVVKMGKLCIEVAPSDKIAFISETLCIGCGLCAKKCPFEAINIVNLPTNLESQVSHRYTANSFKLHRLPTPRAGQVLGMVGQNGTGKSTALKILAGKQKPNLGKYDDPPEWTEILKHYRGSELQNYFLKILEDNLKAIIKPQYVDHIPRAIKVPITVEKMLDNKMELNNKQLLMDLLQLENIKDREINQLSGGELQRFAIAMSCAQKADVYMFDEPSSYLDIKQRLNAAKVIRSLATATTYVIAVEHDLSVLDYLSDFVCCMYGQPAAYGVVTMPFSSREGLNIYLDGYLPTENMRFRQESLNFKIADAADDLTLDKTSSVPYPAMTKTMGGFKLNVKAGEFTDSEVIVMLGENGTGKTTLVRMLAGATKADNEADQPELKVSMKPQKITPKFQGTVRMLLLKQIKGAFMHPQFQTDVVRPMQLDNIIDQDVQTLSGGELQRVAIVLALGKPASVYLLDEPSSFLDSEQRISASRVIKRFILHAKKTAFIVEHDFIMATYLADRVIVFDGQPAIEATANAPQSLLTGMNKFLSSLQVTFRRDTTNYRPRVNKTDSLKDKEQKASGNFFFVGD